MTKTIGLLIQSRMKEFIKVTNPCSRNKLNNIEPMKLIYIIARRQILMKHIIGISNHKNIYKTVNLGLNIY